MVLEELRLHRFRNYEACEASFAAGLVLFLGPNASGKTNLLEAVHLICTGTSHRGARDADMLMWGAPAFAVHGTVRGSLAPVEIGVTYDVDAGKRVTVQGTLLARRSELLEHVAAVAFAPDDLRLVKGEPAQRRRFVDRLAAVLDRRHAADLMELRAVLEQRNQLLRDVRARRTAPALADLFDDQFVRVAARVSARRVEALRRALPEAAGMLASLTAGGERLEAAYLEGGEHPQPLAEDRADTAWWLVRAREALERLRAAEHDRGATLWGPQRDDVRFSISGRDVRVHASQGQQRSVVLALKHAELDLTGWAVGSPPLLLLDDVLSELDPQRSRALLAWAAAHKQSFVTAAADAQGLEPWLRAASMVYEIQGGRLKEVQG